METVNLVAIKEQAPAVVLALNAYWNALKAQEWNDDTSLKMCADLAALIWAKMLGFEKVPALPRTD
jgi:hypothetical protein